MHFFPQLPLQHLLKWTIYGATKKETADTGVYLSGEGRRKERSRKDVGYWTKCLGHIKKVQQTPYDACLSM